MPTGKRCYQVICRFVQALAESEIVTAIAHVDADADGGLAIDAKHLGGRVAVAALDLGDVSQFVEAPIDPEVKVGDIIRLQKSAGDVDEHVLLRCVDDPRGHHGVLLSDCRQDFVEVELEIGELLGREVQIDLLVLISIDFDLADIGRTQELGPSCLGEVARFARRETVISDAIDDSEHIAELVVEERPDDALRKRRLYVADLLANLIPNVIDLALGRRFFEVDKDGCLARFGVTLDVVEVRGLFELLFEAVGHLLEGIGRGGPWPGCLNHHGLHREVRVFLAAKALVGALCRR